MGGGGFMAARVALRKNGGYGAEGGRGAIFGGACAGDGAAVVGMCGVRECIYCGAYSGVEGSCCCACWAAGEQGPCEAGDSACAAIRGIDPFCSLEGSPAWAASGRSRGRPSPN